MTSLQTLQNQLIIGSSKTIPPGPSGERILIRVYGDSLSLPRFEDGIPFHETYPEIVCRELAVRLSRPVHLYNRSMGGASIQQLMTAWENDSRYFGDVDEVLIIQLGIVDCAPRPLGPRLRAAVGMLPTRLRRPIIRFLHNNRARILRSGLGSRFTPPRVFKQVYQNWLKRVSNTHRGVTFVINIAPTIPTIEAHSPGLTASIELYNAMISDIVLQMNSPCVRLVDVHRHIQDRKIEEYIHAIDGHHITYRGHQLYAELILAEDVVPRLLRSQR